MRVRRMALGVSAEDLAMMMGEHGVRLSVQQIAAIEKGKRRAVDYEVLTIARALDVTVDWLITGNER